MNYRIIPVTAFAQNCSLIWCEQTRLAALVDPGGDAERIKQEVSAAGVSLMQILLCNIAQIFTITISPRDLAHKFWRKQNN